MRYGVLSLILLVCAGVLACSDSARVARREIDRVTRLTLASEARLKRVTRERLARVAVEEGAAMGAALRAAGCPSASSVQPASAPEQCHSIAREYVKQYKLRSAKIAAAAAKVDALFEATWAALLPIVDVLEDLDAGLGDKAALQASLANLVADAGRVLADAVADPVFRAAAQLIEGAP
jgi:hypothetical protein